MEDNQFEKELFEIKNAKGTIKKLIKSMLHQKLRLFIVIISVIFHTTFNIISPLYSAKVIDIIWDNIKESLALGNTFKITWEIGGFQIFTLLLVYIGSALFYTLQNFIMASFAEKLNLHLREEISKKFQKLNLEYYDKYRVGEIMSPVVNDLDKMSEALQTGLLKLFTSIATIIGSIFIMFSFSVSLTIIFLVFTGISLLLTKIVSKRTLKYASERQSYVSKLNGLIEESYSGRMIIKSFNYENTSSVRIHESTENLAKITRKTDFIINAINPLIRLVNRLGLVIIAIFGGLMLLNGKFSPGKFQAFFEYVIKAGEPITEMSFMINSIQSALASVERVYKLLEEKEMTDDSKLISKLENIKGNVSFRNVRFGYFEDNLLIKNVSFDAKSGQKIAIVGSTGAGKTTLINLLMRFYDINGGNILLDEYDAQNISRAALRENFGMVLQDTWLFEGTIAENIAYGKLDATRDEIIKAAKIARADFFIRTMQNGYDTILNNDAENISIGQRQLLTIARVVLCNPSILILDEATSSVDTKTEIEIVKAMKSLMQNRTSFVIAHRLSTIIDADLILVMQSGNIIEQGNHKELLNAKGYYYELYNSQFA